jgi:L-rhamnose isomerase
MERFGFVAVGVAALCTELRDMERFGFVPVGVAALCTESNLEEVDFLDVDLACVQYGDELQLEDFDGTFEAVVDLVGDRATATPSRTKTARPLRQQLEHQ